MGDRWMTHDFLDGPGFRTWLLETAPAVYHRLDGTTKKGWANGKPVQVFYADRLCVRANLHLSDIPDDLWVDPVRTDAQVAGELGITVDGLRRARTRYPWGLANKHRVAA